MSQLICELCGGNDLAKQDGFFVCQKCGAKYSVEEARKLMGIAPAAVPEPVAEPVKETVRIDRSEQLNNLYQLARRAMDESDYEGAKKYYGEILFTAPNDWEAAFYTTYCNSLTGTIGQLEQSANSLANCIENVYKMVAALPTDEEQKAALEAVCEKTHHAAVVFVENAITTYRNSSSTDKTDCVARVDAALRLLLTTAACLPEPFKEKPFFNDIGTQAAMNFLNLRDVYLYNRTDKDPYNYTHGFLTEKVKGIVDYSTEIEILLMNTDKDAYENYKDEEKRFILSGLDRRLSSAKYSLRSAQSNAVTVIGMKTMVVSAILAVLSLLIGFGGDDDYLILFVLFTIACLVVIGFCGQLTVLTRRQGKADVYRYSSEVRDLEKQIEKIKKG